MIRAYRLYTGPDGHSHVTRGSIIYNEVIPAESILYEETAPHSSPIGKIEARAEEADSDKAA